MPLAIPSGTLLTARLSHAIASSRTWARRDSRSARLFATASRNSLSPGWLTSGSRSDVCVVSTYRSELTVGLCHRSFGVFQMDLNVCGSRRHTRIPFGISLSQFLELRRLAITHVRAFA